MDSGFSMDKGSQLALLRLARQAIEARLRGLEPPALPAMEDAPAEFGGLFVTLHSGRRLRGCIGRFDPDSGLAETVQTMAVAALADPRFRHMPVRLEELPDLRIEISILSKMVRTAEPLSLQPGVHGIYVRRGAYAGCFLPQVAPEQGWDREMLLTRCCADKAGLPGDSWKDPQTEVYLVTSTVFEEDKKL